MKIRKIHIENINSLAGKWDIDFTDAAYSENHGMFVISGPTGAGKTSVLDAVTLALYGRTARQARFKAGAKTSEGINEVMTRGKSFCMARVEYECHSKVYVSEWSQRRARDSATGSLQAVEINVIQIAPSNEIVLQSSNSSALVKTTTAIIALDYDQFSRSIMLAQGEFNKFLMCDERDRAKILETISGATQYREIGKHICDRYKAEDNKMEQMNSYLKSIEGNILSAEDRAKTQDKLQELAAQEKSLGEEQEAINRRIAWKKSFDECKDDVARLKTALDNAKDAQKSFAPQSVLLQKADRAAQCEASYNAVCSNRVAQDKNKALIESLSRSFDTAEAQAAKAAADKETSQMAADKAVQEAEASQPVINKMREMDSEINAAQKTVNENTKRYQSAKTERDNAKNTLDNLIARGMNISRQLSIAEDYATANHGDGDLREKIAAGSQLRDRINEQRQQMNDFIREQKGVKEKALQTRYSLDAAQRQLDVVIAEKDTMVQGNAKVVARELQKRLVPGTPCPVCGSLKHAVSNNLAIQSPHDDTEMTHTGSKDVLADMVERLNHADNQIESLQNDISRLSSEVASFNAKAQALDERVLSCKTQRKEDINAFCALFALWADSLKGMNPAQALDALSDRVKIWQQNQDNIVHIREEQSAIKAAISAAQQVLADKENVLTQAASEKGEADKAIQTLITARHAQFGDKSADNEERLLAQKVKDTRSSLVAATDAMLRAQRQTADLEGRLASITKSLEDIVATGLKANQVFQSILTDNGFDGENPEADFLQARMPSSDREAKRDRLQEINDNVIRREAEYSNSNESLSRCMKTQHNTEDENAPLSELVSLLGTTKDRIAECQNQIAAVNAVLKADDTYHLDADAARKKRDDQLVIWQKWQRMKSWIGVQSGEDFSVFVQGITFRTLINAANRNLIGITDRYTLRASGSLDFLVEDDSLGRTRSVTNLSGGEKFQVSLSLALGIADFARGETQINSLFLDEGFGTLDAQSLERVIRTLSHMQGNRKNSTLGIITHVAAVIDSIPLRIEVTPICDGKSRLSGAGVTGH